MSNGGVSGWEEVSDEVSVVPVDDFLSAHVGPEDLGDGDGAVLVLVVLENGNHRWGSGLYLILALLAWKSVKLLHEDASSQASFPGA